MDLVAGTVSADCEPWDADSDIWPGSVHAHPSFNKTGQLIVAALYDAAGKRIVDGTFGLIRKAEVLQTETVSSWDMEARLADYGFRTAGPDPVAEAASAK